MRWLFATILLIQTAPRQSEADKLEAALKKFGDRTFSVLEKGKKVGTYSLKHRFVTEDEVKLVVFEDRIERTSNDTSRTVEFTEKATYAGLALNFGTETRSDSGAGSAPSISFEGRDGVLTVDGKKHLLKDVAGAHGERALLRLICMKEQKVGATLETRVLSIDPAHYHMARTIKCVAKEPLQIAGRKIEAFKWEDKVSDTAFLTGKPTSFKIDNTYWVGPDRHIVRMKSGDLEMVLESSK